MEPCTRLDQVNLYDPDVWVDGVPHHMFDYLRANHPVYRHPMPDYPGAYWAVTRHADVVFMSKNPKLFSSAQGTNIEHYEGDALTMLQTLLINMDPPQHNKYRKLVRKGFTPRMVAAMERGVRAVTTKILDQIAHKGECDFVTDVAAELPLQVIVEMMGVPQEDRHMIFELSNRLIGFDDPEFTTSKEDGQMAAAQMYGYAHQLADKRRIEPMQDLVTVLLDAELDGEKLTEQEFDSFFLILNVAGNETTRNLTAHGMYNLMTHPDQQQRLADDPSLMSTTVEEMLRYSPPVSYFRRTATQDLELHGQQISKGDMLAMYYPSVNRDEDVFEDPHRFDITRSPNNHLSFGIGEHFCLGASLARLEIRVLFEEIMQRFPDMRLAGPVRRLRSNFLAGIKSMPVEFTPEH